MRHSPIEDDTCFAIDSIDDVISNCVQEMLDEDLLNELLEEAEESAQNIDVMEIFEKEPLLQPPPCKQKPRSQQ